MFRQGNIFAIACIIMATMSGAHAAIVSQTNFVGSNGLSITVPESGANNAGKVVISAVGGSVTSGNAGLTTGGTVYSEVRPAQTNNGSGYLGAPATTSAATNLAALDTAISAVHPKNGSVKIPSGSETSSSMVSIWVE